MEKLGLMTNDQTAEGHTNRHRGPSATPHAPLAIRHWDLVIPAVLAMLFANNPG